MNVSWSLLVFFAYNRSKTAILYSQLSNIVIKCTYISRISLLQLSKILLFYLISQFDGFDFIN